MTILITVAVMAVAMVLLATSYVLLRDARGARSIAGRGAIVAVIWAVAIGAGAAAAVWWTSDDEGDSASAARPTATSAPTSEPSRNATLSGTLVLDGVPLQASALGARVVRGGFVAACQASIPEVVDGVYEIEVMSAAEAPGCGAEGADVLLWAYTDTTLYAMATADWPGDGVRAAFDVEFASAKPEGASMPVTEAYGTVVDANGDTPPPGTPVEAFIGEAVCGVSEIRRYGDEDGFLIIISGVELIPACTEGAEVTFRVGGVTANETIVHNLNAGGDDVYDAVRLTIDGTVAP